MKTRNKVVNKHLNNFKNIKTKITKNLLAKFLKWKKYKDKVKKISKKIILSNKNYKIRLK